VRGPYAIRVDNNGNLGSATATLDDTLVDDIFLETTLKLA